MDIVGSIEKTIKASHSVDDINARWARIQDLMKQLPATDVPLLQALPKFAEDIPRSEIDPSQPATLEDVTSLAASFTQVEQFVTQLVTELSPKPGHEIVFAELAKDPAAQLPTSGTPTLEQYNALPGHRPRLCQTSLPTQRATVDWAKSLGDIQKQFIDIIKTANAQDSNLPMLIQAQGKLTADVSALLRESRPFKRTARSSKKNVDDANVELASLRKKTPRLGSPLISSIPRPTSPSNAPARLLRRWRRVRRSSSPSGKKLIRRYWRKVEANPAHA